MPESLKSTLANKKLVLDGALGTQLEELIPASSPLSVKGSPLWSTKVLLADPSIVKTVHTSYIDAGADVIMTSTYQALFPTLQTHEHMTLPQAQKVWQTAVDVAKAATAAAPKHAYIAGSVGPYGAFLANGAEYSGDYNGLTVAQLVEYHEPLVRFYATSPHTDVIAFETVPNFNEVQAILELMKKLAAESVHKEFFVCFSCPKSSALADGTDLADVLSYISSHLSADIAPYFVGVGVNCIDFEKVSGLVNYMNSASDLRFDLIVYPNLGFNNDMSDASQYGFRSATDHWGAAIEEWLQVPNVKLIGSCCSTGPKEVAVISDKMP